MPVALVSFAKRERLFTDSSNGNRLNEHRLISSVRDNIIQNVSVALSKLNKSYLSISLLIGDFIDHLI